MCSWLNLCGLFGCVQGRVDRAQQGTGGIAEVLPEHYTAEVLFLNEKALAPQRLGILIGDELMRSAVVGVGNLRGLIPVPGEAGAEQRLDIGEPRVQVGGGSARLEEAVVGR